MSLNFGGVKVDGVTSDADLLIQEGKIPVRPRGEQVVYYPIAFAAAPNLELEDPKGVCDIVDQNETCFTVRFHADAAGNQQALCWKARGQRVAQGVIAPAGPKPETPPTTTSVPSSSASIGTVTTQH
jgi:hypothetical protein